MEATEKAIHTWMQEWGYHAVAPALLADPAGVPWAWIFLMLLAEEARMNIALVLFYGFMVVMVTDHILYWVGAAGSHKLLPWLYKKWPGLECHVVNAQREVVNRGAMAIVFGRYLPVIGRWTGIGAGLARVPYGRFTFFETIGAGISVLGFGLLAHFVGREIVDHPYFHEFLIAAFVLGMLVTVLGIVIAKCFRKPAQPA